MHDLERLCAAVPIGENNAEGATAIWMRYDLGARGTVQHRLNRLSVEGRIMRKSRPLRSGLKHLYYRAQTPGPKAKGK